MSLFSSAALCVFTCWHNIESDLELGRGFWGYTRLIGPVVSWYILSVQLVGQDRSGQDRHGQV